MSPQAPELLELGLKRFAFALTSAMVRAIIPSGRVGVYLLLLDESPLYVGRSDTCIRTRLAGHPMLGRATHFSWQPCRDAVHAFHLEAFWYHALRESGLPIRNQTHPARPAGLKQTCPFCRSTELDSLRQALRGSTVIALGGRADRN